MKTNGLRSSEVQMPRRISLGGWIKGVFVMSFLRSSVVCVAAISFTSFVLPAQVKNEPTVVKIDSRVFDRYVGAYVIGRQYSTVFREGDHFYAQITGQKPYEIFPQSDHEFFMKVDDAPDVQLTFIADANGKTYKLSLRQGGPPQWAPSPQLSERETKLVVEQQKAGPQRFKDQKQDPRTEPLMRQFVDDVRHGKPQYNRMLPSLAGMLREDLGNLQDDMEPLGAFKSMVFKGVSEGGSDIYQVKFENGQMEFRLGIATDGTIVLLAWGHRGKALARIPGLPLHPTATHCCERSEDGSA
jgi:hypothetical protein